MDKLLNVKQVAEILNVSPRTIWSLMARRDFPQSVKLGRCTRWDEADIAKYISRRKAD